MKSLNIQEVIKDKNYSGLSKLLKEGMTLYLQGDHYKNYLKFISKFPKYSPKNLNLLYHQNSKVIQVASFNKWKEMGRHVTKGAKALYIYAPSIRIKKDKAGQPVKNDKGEVQKTTTFILVPVFDVAQTSGKELPKLVNDLGGDFTDPHLFLTTYQALSSTSPVPIAIQKIEDAEVKGYFTPQDSQIVLQKSMGQNMTIKTLIHEVSHARLHADSTTKFGDSTYRRQEFEAESVAYIVSNHLGIDASEYSFGYLANWTKGDIEQFSESLKVIVDESKAIISEIEVVLEKVQNLAAPSNKFEERIQEAVKKISKNSPEVRNTLDPKVNLPHQKL